MNNSQDGDAIMKALSEIMSDLGMKLNSLKTKSSDQIVRNSVKEDKIHCLSKKSYGETLQKQLLLIHDFSGEFPNSGSLARALDTFHKRILRKNNIYGNIVPHISILTDIAYHNPRTYPVCAAILSKYISLIDGDDQKKIIFEKIKKKFSKLPNTGYLQIWLQRISITFDKSADYDEPLCKLVSSRAGKIWNNDWLSPDFEKIMDTHTIIDNNEIERLNPVIPLKEIELFQNNFQES